MRHISGDDAVVMAEIESPGNKDQDRRKTPGLFVEKAAWLLDLGVHLQSL